ncbi:MAG: SusD/RagB family nutrient-binding outer membrane lipoprotein, partial [Bacteroidetes bacterium]
MNYKNISFVFLLSLTIISFSCDFETDNASPDEITEASLEELLPAAITQMAHNQSALLGRSASVIIQNLSGFDSSVQPFKQNLLPPGGFNNVWNYGFFSGSLIQAKTIADMAEKQGEGGYEAVAKIIMAHEFAEATASFGDIPFSQAVQGNVYPFPEYDSQQAVYEGVQNLLDEAILLLEQNPFSLSGDVLYNGNMQFWKKFAYALKARYLLHTSKRHPENFNEILDIVQNETFQNLEEQPDFFWGAQVGTQNPLYSFATERPNTLIIQHGFANKLETNNDPRLDKIMFTDGTTWFFYDSDNPNKLVWARQYASIPLISFAEIKFIEAEALLQTGGTTEEITEALKTAIESSFLQMEIDPEDHTDFIDNHSD